MYHKIESRWFQWKDVVQINEWWLLTVLGGEVYEKMNNFFDNCRAIMCFICYACGCSKRYRSRSSRKRICFSTTVYVFGKYTGWHCWTWRAEAGISDVPITQEILDNCIATSIDVNGKETVLEVKADNKGLRNSHAFCQWR